jgi:hypothetical protein
MLKRIASILAVLMLTPCLLLAQGSTTASINGVVKDQSGETLPGANVVAKHLPSGTTYGTSTRANGRYTIKNMRVGGPYEIRVSFVSYKTTVKEDVTLELGQELTLDFTLQEGSTELEEITVVGQQSAVMNSERTGARTNISSTEINETPSISRSLTDFTRLTPQVTSGYSFGGANDRYNNILVDGATLNDVFGLGSGTPGSQAGVSSPISIDAIQEFNVDIAPFDVVNNNFTGGQVNAITKSGTNTYTGTVYFQTRNENMVGNFDQNDGYQEVMSEDYPEFAEQYYGLTAGGPIIKDKLFFFVNAELRRETQPLTTGINGSGAATVFPADPSLFNQVNNIMQSNYSYDPGGYGMVDMAQDNNKVLAKLDWNINQNHKLTFRYNYVDATDEEGISRGRYSYSLSNRQYNFNSTQNSFLAQLKSTFGNNMYNEFRAVYTRIRDSRDVVAQPFPEINLSLSIDGDYRSIYMGIDRFSQANRLDQDLYEITDNFTYLMGDHEFTLGTSNQIFKFDNLFVQDAFGTYEFRSLNDLANGNPYSYNYSYLLDGGSPSAQFTGMQLGLYVQDKWSVNDYLNVTIGLRADMPLLPDSPTYNPTAEDAFGYRTDNVASGNILWSPRLGFNWDLSQGQRSTQLRGGIGIFSGTPPFVWISNQYSNTGADYGRVAVNDYDINLGDGFFSPDPNNQPTPGGSTNLPTVQTTEINLIADDFKYPQSLKIDLALDQELPGGILATLEGIYSKAINEVVFRNINLEVQDRSAYGRPIYGSIYYNSYYGTASGNPTEVDNRFTNALLLDNTNKGYQYSITGELSKRFESGFRARLAYTYNRAESVNNGSSSRAISNWQYNENFDVNDPSLGTADYERRHRILADLSYTARYADRFSTTISLIYDGRSGSPFSWIYDGDANGDGRYDNDLMYIPASESEVVLASNNWDEYNDWINSTSSLSDYRGEVLPRNTAREPWTNYVDLRLNQKIETFNGQTVELTASMFNVLNFLNSEWGVRRGVSYNNYRAVNFRQYVDQNFINNNPQYNLSSSDIGKPVIDFRPSDVTDDRIFSISDYSSRWQLQFGIKYNF